MDRRGSAVVAAAPVVMARNKKKKRKGKKPPVPLAREVIIAPMPLRAANALTANPANAVPADRIAVTLL